MLVDVTIKRFWEGRLIGPDTPHQRIDYNGDPEKMPRGFALVSEERLISEAELNKAMAIAQKVSASEGITLVEAMTAAGDKLLPASGGVDQATIDMVKSAKVPTEAKPEGVQPEGVDKPGVVEAAQTPKQKESRDKREKKLADKNDKIES